MPYWLRKRDLDMNVTGPVFDYKGKEYTVQSSKECRLWLLDTAMLGGEDHRSPVYPTPLVCNEEVNFTMGVWGALATWEDPAGTRWVLTPFWGPSIRSSRRRSSTDRSHTARSPRSRSKSRAGRCSWCRPGSPGSHGGSSGDRQRHRVRLRQRREHDATMARARPARRRRGPHSGVLAVLYALDGQTGKELWSSGDQITSWNHFSGLSVANGRVYIGTFDGMLYCGAASLPSAATSSAQEARS